MSARFVNAWSTPDEMRNDEVANEKHSQSERTSPAQVTLWNDVRHWPFADKAQDQQAPRHRQAIDDQRVRQNVLPKWPPLAEQAEAQPHDSNHAVPACYQAP